MDANAAATLLNAALNRWLSVRLEILGGVCTLLAALVTVEQQGRNAAAMGLLLTYALQVELDWRVAVKGLNVQGILMLAWLGGLFS